MSASYSISVLCFNRRGMTDRCLRSVLAHSPADAEIIATDNGSSDGTRDLLRALADGDSRLRVVENEANEGIGGPKSRACASARGEFFVSLDNDAWVGPGWLDALRGPMDADSGVVQVGRAGQHQTLHTNGIGFPGPTVEYIDGSCFMVRTAVANLLGLCDPFYPFAYADDSDFSLRARARGYKIAVAPVPVWHPHEHQKEAHGGLDIGNYLAQNSQRLALRWRDYLRRRAFDPTIAVKRTSAFGDVLIATGLVKRIKDLWPFSRIFFCTDLPVVLDSNPLVESVLPAREYRGLAPRMAYAWDLDGVYERDLSVPYWKSFVRSTGILSDAEPMRPALYVSPAAKEAALAAVGTATRPVVVCATPTTWDGKNIDPRVWRPLLSRLRGEGHWLVEVGSGAAAFPDLVHSNLVGQTSFQVLAGIIERAALFVGPDSAPFHIAEAFGVRSLAFFGCTLPGMVSAHPAAIPVSAEGLDCLGCHHRQPAGTTSFRGCARGDFACRGIDPQQVPRLLNGLLGTP